MTDDELLTRMIELERRLGIRQGIEYAMRRQQKLLEQRMHRQQPVAGFPVSLLEQLLYWAVGHVERGVDRTFRSAERMIRRLFKR